jgi:hypothetical protein
MPNLAATQAPSTETTGDCAGGGRFPEQHPSSLPEMMTPASSHDQGPANDTTKSLEECGQTDSPNTADTPVEATSPWTFDGLIDFGADPDDSSIPAASSLFTDDPAIKDQDPLDSAPQDPYPSDLLDVDAIAQTDWPRENHPPQGPSIAFLLQTNSNALVSPTGGKSAGTVASNVQEEPSNPHSPEKLTFTTASHGTMDGHDLRDDTAHETEGETLMDWLGIEGSAPGNDDGEMMWEPPKDNAWQEWEGSAGFLGGDLSGWNDDLMGYGNTFEDLMRLNP